MNGTDSPDALTRLVEQSHYLPATSYALNMARIDTAEGQLTVPLPAEQAWAKALEAFGRVGVVEEQRLAEQRIIGIVPSGFGGMNGAYVEVQVLAAGDATTEVKVQASAQEGLIKQRTAPKAVDKFLSELGSEGNH